MKWICAILVTLAVSVEARLWETEYEMVGRYGQPKDTQAQSPTALDLKKKLDAEKAKRKGGPPQQDGRNVRPSPRRNGSPAAGPRETHRTAASRLQFCQRECGSMVLSES